MLGFTQTPKVEEVATRVLGLTSTVGAVKGVDLTGCFLEHRELKGIVTYSTQHRLVCLEFTAVARQTAGNAFSLLLVRKKQKRSLQQL